MKRYDLIVRNLERLSLDIYQDTNCIDSEKEANEILGYMIENLNQIYELLNHLDGLDFLEKMNNNKLYEVWDKIDVYQLGDTLNLLERTNIKVVK